MKEKSESGNAEEDLDRATVLERQCRPADRRKLRWKVWRIPRWEVWLPVSDLLAQHWQDRETCGRSQAIVAPYQLWRMNQEMKNPEIWRSQARLPWDLSSGLGKIDEVAQPE